MRNKQEGWYSRLGWGERAWEKAREEGPYAQWVWRKASIPVWPEQGLKAWLRWQQVPLKVFEWCPSRHAEQVSPQVRAKCETRGGKRGVCCSKGSSATTQGRQSRSLRESRKGGNDTKSGKKGSVEWHGQESREEAPGGGGGGQPGGPAGREALR